MTGSSRIVVSLFAAFSAAAVVAETATYLIELSNGNQVLSADRPVTRGTVLTFHPHPRGPLTGIPMETVVRIVPGRAATEPATVTVGSVVTAPATGSVTVRLGPAGSAPSAYRSATTEGVAIGRPERR